MYERSKNIQEIIGMEVENLDMVDISTYLVDEPVAKNLIKTYKLRKGSKILDVGCGKGFLKNY